MPFDLSSCWPALKSERTKGPGTRCHLRTRLSSDMGDSTNTVPMGEVLRHDTLALLRDAMRNAGQATQTLAAMRRLAGKNGETFASIGVICDISCQPYRTVEDHLRKLVAYEWLKCRGRQGRRTATYTVPPDLLNRCGRLKYALLPRWAAKLLDSSWADRAIFACIISRETLCTEVLDDPAEDGGECYMRRQYSVATLAKDSGLSRRTIDKAKRRLVDRGLLTIQPAINVHDDQGRFVTMADSLFLNSQFPVDKDLLARRVKAPSKPLLSPKHRSAKSVDMGRNFRGYPSAKSVDEGAQFPCPYIREPLKESIKRTSERTPPLDYQGPGGVLLPPENQVQQEKKTNGKPDISSIDIEESRRKAKQDAEAFIAADAADAAKPKPEPVASASQ